MKIISISMVRNEEDIIETFIRYHIMLLDSMVILDNGSSDATADILLKLQREGLPIYLVFDNTPSYDQAEITTNLLYSTVDLYQPDYVLPLDVDEFIASEKNDGSNLRELLERTLVKDTIHYISWRTYVPTVEDNTREKNILKRITHRRKVEHNHDQKVIIHSSIPKKYKISIKQGNHDIETGNSKNSNIRINRMVLSTLKLAHYPIRSVNQVKSKYLVGWLANLARKQQVLFDWYPFYNLLKENKGVTKKDLTSMALHYNVINKDETVEIINDPLQFSNDIKLKYNEVCEMDYAKNVLNYAETLSLKYSATLNSNTYPAMSSSEYQEQMILQIIKDYTFIKGWLSVREAIELYKLVRGLRKKKDIVICEIGAWQGKSSFVLAKAIEDKEDAILYCIDPFNGDGDEASKDVYVRMNKDLDMPLIEIFKENMNAANLLHKINIIQGYSYEIIKNFTRKIDLLFVDGNHDYAAVLDDYKSWSPLIKKGGYIAFHDVGATHTTGPKQLVERFIVKNPGWGEYRLVDELYWIKKK